MRLNSTIAGVVALVALTGATAASWSDRPEAPAPHPAAVAQATPYAFVETFDGSPAQPQAFGSPRWAMQPHHRNLTGDFDGAPEALPPHTAGHGADCAPPPATHAHPAAPALGHVYQCRDHVMTSLLGDPYGAIYMTPAALADWSGGSTVIAWSQSLTRSSAREWTCVTITPWGDHMALPATRIIDNDLNGPPAHSITVCMDLFTDRITAGATGVSYDGGCFSWGCEAYRESSVRAFSSVVVPDAARRDRFELTITGRTVTLRMPDYGATIYRGERDSDLPWASGTVQLEAHSYSPDKGCSPQGGPSVTGDCSLGTWHFDDVRIEPAQPLTLIQGDSFVLRPGSAHVNFSAPAPAGAKLRFSAVGTVDVSFANGAVGSFARAVPQGGMGDELHASSYWLDVPAGTRSADFTIAPPAGGSLAMRYVAGASIWAPTTIASTPTPTPSPTAPATGTASPSPTASASPTPSSTPPASSSPTPAASVTASPTAAPSATPTTPPPSPTATPSPAPTPEPCEVAVYVNGVPMRVAREPAFCAGAHP